jgi:hypothetical protein
MAPLGKQIEGGSPAAITARACLRNALVEGTLSRDAVETVSGLIQQLQAAQAAGLQYVQAGVETQSIKGGAKAMHGGRGRVSEARTYPAGKGFVMEKGPRADATALLPGQFVAESGFLVWLLGNNVTVCDLGGGFHALMMRGNTFPRHPARHSAAEVDTCPSGE